MGLQVIVASLISQQRRIKSHDFVVDGLWLLEMLAMPQAVRAKHTPQPASFRGCDQLSHVPDIVCSRRSHGERNGSTFNLALFPHEINYMGFGKKTRKSMLGCACLQLACKPPALRLEYIRLDHALLYGWFVARPRL